MTTFYTMSFLTNFFDFFVRLPCRRNSSHSYRCRHTICRLLWLRLRRCRDTWSCPRTTSDLCYDGSHLRYGRTYFLLCRTSHPYRWLLGCSLGNNCPRQLDRITSCLRIRRILGHRTHHGDSCGKSLLSAYLLCIVLPQSVRRAS